MLTIEGDPTPFWNDKLKHIHCRLTNWRRIFPSRLGKNFIAKLSLYSCIWYYTQSMEVPEKISNELKNMINTFIWSTKKAKQLRLDPKHTLNFA